MSTKCIWAPPLAEVQHYSMSNSVMCSKYATDQYSEFFPKLSHDCSCPSFFQTQHTFAHTTHTSMPLCSKRLRSTILRSSVPCKCSSLWGDPVTRKWANQNHFSTCLKSLVGVCVHVYLRRAIKWMPARVQSHTTSCTSSVTSQDCRNILYECMYLMVSVW